MSTSSSDQAGSSELSCTPTVQPAPALLSLDSESTTFPTVTSEPSSLLPHSSNSYRDAESSRMPQKAIGLIELTRQENAQV